MAEGLLLVLSGEDVHRKDEFTGLDKTYTLDVLWGIETDTYDLLGLPQEKVGDMPSTEEIKSEAERRVGTFEQQYPPYSSKTVNGKPLWRWTREGRLSEIEIPTRKVTIYSIEHRYDCEIGSDELLETIRYRLPLVSGDFRQEAVEHKWRTPLRGLASQRGFMRSCFEVSCSSGTYMRSLAHEMGKELGCGACAYAIRRDKVGEFSVQDTNLEPGKKGKKT